MQSMLKTLPLLLKKMKAFLIYYAIITAVLCLYTFFSTIIFHMPFFSSLIWSFFVMLPIHFLLTYITGPLFALWFQRHDFTAKEVILSAFIMFILIAFNPTMTIKSAFGTATVYCAVYVIAKKVRHACHI